MLPGKLQDPGLAADMGAPGVLMSAWTKMLSLLADPVASVRQAAAPIVGCIGAMATKQPSRAGTTSAILSLTPVKCVDTSKLAVADSSAAGGSGSMLISVAEVCCACGSLSRLKLKVQRKRSCMRRRLTRAAV